MAGSWQEGPAKGDLRHSVWIAMDPENLEWCIAGQYMKLFGRWSVNEPGVLPTAFDGFHKTLDAAFGRKVRPEEVETATLILHDALYDDLGIPPPGVSAMCHVCCEAQHTLAGSRNWEPRSLQGALEAFKQEYEKAYGKMTFNTSLGNTLSGGGLDEVCRDAPSLHFF